MTYLDLCRLQNLLLKMTQVEIYHDIFPLVLFHYHLFINMSMRSFQHHSINNNAETSLSSPSKYTLSGIFNE